MKHGDMTCPNIVDGVDDDDLFVCAGCLDARIRAVEAIRLPLTELLSPDQLELFGGL